MMQLYNLFNGIIKIKNEMAKITIALVRMLEQKVASAEISFSRMVEILNEQAKLNEGNEFEFYKIKSDKVNWRGERYFKFRWNSNEVLQVCLEINNDTKRGKGHYVGIYKISRVSLFTNWYPQYVEICSENEFNIAFEKAVTLLKKNKISTPKLDQNIKHNGTDELL